MSVGVEFTDDVEAAGRRHADGYAFTFGAMGSATTNFYNRRVRTPGLRRRRARGATTLARRRQGRGPASAFRLAIGLGTNLIGTDDLVRDRLRLYAGAGVTVLRVGVHSDPALGLDGQLTDLARLLDLVAEVNGSR